MSTTHQTAVSETETAAATPDGGIRSLVVYAVSTVLIAAAVTAGGLIATRADPATTAAGPTAQAFDQQLVDGIDPSIDVPTALGLPGTTANVDANAALVDGIDPSIDVPAALGLATTADSAGVVASATGRKR